jgi:glycosyltransferase involved in cell wall biosynthesis
MNAPLPSITAVIVTRDRPRLLGDALASVVRQSLAPLEVRIGNDGAGDVTAALAELPLLEATVIETGAGQAGAARNLAAHGARGAALAFLDDDDRWLPSHVADLSRALEDPAVEVAFTDSAIVREEVDERGARRDLERRVIARDWDPALMRHDDYIPPSGWAVRRALFERLGGFDPAFPYSEDWDFLLRAAGVTTPRRVPGVTVEVRMRASGNASAARSPERLDCLARLARRHGLAPLEPRTFWEVAEIVAVAEGAPWRERC